jgi:hypothetical protein
MSLRYSVSRNLFLLLVLSGPASIVHAGEPLSASAHLLIPICAVSSDYARHEAGASAAIESPASGVNAFGLSGSDWRVLSAACGKLSSSIMTIAAEARTLQSQARSQGRDVDQAFVTKYNCQRDSALAGALARIRAGMSSDGWYLLQRRMVALEQRTLRGKR